MTKSLAPGKTQQLSLSKRVVGNGPGSRCPKCALHMAWVAHRQQWYCDLCHIWSQDSGPHLLRVVAKDYDPSTGAITTTPDSVYLGQAMLDTKVRSALLAMSKKEYTMFAKFVRHMRKHDGGDEATIKLFVDMSAAWFSHDNPNFNEGMFRTACGE